MIPFLKLKLELMDKEHQIAVNTLQKLLKPFTDEFVHIHNVQLAKLSFIYSTIPLDSPPEKWAPVITKQVVKDRYLVSSWGRVFDIKNSFYPYSHKCDKGYIRVGLEREGTLKSKTATIRIHKLVADAFLTPIDGKEHINHKDTIKTNNTLSNLEWCTPQENVTHSLNNGCRINTHSTIKFSVVELEDIHMRYANGEKLKDIALFYNRRFRAISDIVNGKTYKLGYYSNGK